MDETTARTVRLPAPIIRGTVSSRTLSDIVRPRDEAYENMFKSGQDTVGSFYLPPFQRGSAWTSTQAARLVESIHLGIAIGGIVVSNCGAVVRTPDGDRFPDQADWLIDGQQRLRSISRYLDDDLTVFAGTQGEHRYGELSRPQQRAFMATTMGFVMLEPEDTATLARIYDLLNFGGTAHREDERASGAPTG